jgi:hypothetical protein
MRVRACARYLGVGLLAWACSSSEAGGPDDEDGESGAAGQGQGTSGADDGTGGADDGAHGGEAARGGAGGTETNPNVGGDDQGPLAGAGGGSTGEPLPDVLSELLDAALHGGAVDLDGDGAIDITFVIQGTDRTTYIPRAEQPVLTVTRHADGSAEKSGDFDLDGAEDFDETELWTETSLARVTLRDANFDGHFEAREHLELDLTATTFHFLSEAQAPDETTWTKVDEQTGVSTSAAGGECLGLENYPPAGQTNDQTIVGHIRIATAKPNLQLKGTCTPSQAARIQSALGSLFRNTLDELAPLEDFADAGAVQCLARRDAAFVESFVNTMANGPGARIACGGGCSGVYGATDPGTPRINLNFSEIGASDSLLQSTLLHEMIHSSGFRHKDNGTTDSIYACERWCTGNSVDAAGNLNMQDCFRCSASLAAKQECCGDLTVCAGGCCDGPCQPDGTCGVCSTAKANGLSCIYEGTTRLDATVNDAGWLYDGQIRLVATDLVTEYQKAQSPTIHRGIRYKPTGTITASFSGVPGCVPSPASVQLTDSNLVGEIIIGIDPPVVIASCTVSIPGGTAIVCQQGGSPPTGDGWGWFFVTPSEPVTTPILTGSSTLPESNAKSFWNWKPVSE